MTGSKRFDGTGNFGFALVRMHPMTAAEEKTKKNTYYEYFCPAGKIPEFQSDEMGRRTFKSKEKP